MLERSYHVIKDPVHGTMQFSTVEDQWIKPIINHPLFQRLRHIKQLGLTDMVFPGAVHTRFNHCLGCCYIATQIANKLGLSERQRQIVALSALLHDIGHGPFSHTIEDLFQDRMIRHEEWTPAFLQAFSQPAFIAQYNAVNSKYPLDNDLLQTIQHIIMHQPSDQPLLADIVSSQLDADRFDYLLRDSHFCGVKYGEYDFRWLLHCLTAIDYQGQQRLGITYKGIGAVEQYLNARRLMMRNIYHHAKKVAMGLLLIKFLKRFSSQQADADIKQQSSPLLHFLQQVREFNHNPSEAKKTQFIQDNFANYSLLTDYDVFALLRDVATSDSQYDTVELAKRIYFRHVPKVYPLSKQQYQQAKAKIAELKVPEWQLFLFHLPHQSYHGDMDPILVQFDNDIKPLGEVSLMVNALTDRFEDTYYLSIDPLLLQQQHMQQLLKGITQEG